MPAIGLIETKGLLPAIEGADVMLKAAEVRLLEKNLAGGGLVTITVAGEVAAVQAAVDAAACAIRRISGACLVSQHVIPRPDVELSTIIATLPIPVCSKAREEIAVLREEEIPPAESPVSALPENMDSAAEAPDPARLKKMNLSKLRQLASSMQGMELTQEQIDSSGKNALIEAIQNTYRQK